MPSCISQLDGAAYALYTHPNGELKMGRKNADPLVGLPSFSQRNCSAAATRKFEKKKLWFKKRKDYCSMNVSGFVVDTMDTMKVASQSGNIPREWIDLGKWYNTDDDPPEDFWRTLVADRGRHGQNPPTYYALEYKKSIDKGIMSGSLNTTDQIHDGRCSVVSEFFRRVQDVIWNIFLMRTSTGRLGSLQRSTKGRHCLHSIRLQRPRDS
jgi:hypothetical protein